MTANWLRIVAASLSLNVASVYANVNDTNALEATIATLRASLAGAITLATTLAQEVHQIQENIVIVKQSIDDNLTTLGNQHPQFGNFVSEYAAISQDYNLYMDLFMLGDEGGDHFLTQANDQYFAGCSHHDIAWNYMAIGTYTFGPYYEAYWYEEDIETALNLAGASLTEGMSSCDTAVDKYNRFKTNCLGGSYGGINVPLDGGVLDRLNKLNNDIVNCLQ